jgi:uncharacterized protein YaaQ
MKLIIAIIRDEDHDLVSRTLTQESFRVTFIASTGGFLRSGRSTLLIGVEDSRVQAALKIIKECCKTPADPNQKKATIFVLNVAEFIQM